MCLARQPTKEYKSFRGSVSGYRILSLLGRRRSVKVLFLGIVYRDRNKFFLDMEHGCWRILEEYN